MSFSGNQPNILIIVVDALRADRVGAIGGRNLTANIDSFAEDAAVFSNAFTTINATDPAVTSLETGRHPLSHGVVNHGQHVTPEEKRTVQQVTQLSEVFQELGYFTGKLGRPLGRWHRSGFDQYPDLAEGRAAFDSDSTSREIRQRIGQNLSSLHPVLGNSAAIAYRSIKQGLNAVSQLGSTTDTDDEILRQFREISQKRPPFYVLAHLMDPHIPYNVSKKRVWECLDRFEYQNISKSEVNSRFPSREPYPDSIDQEWSDSEYGLGTAVASAHYDAAVLEADERIGAYIDYLRNNHILDDTFVVILGDHGESLTEHEIYYDHHGLYDETIRIPLIIRPPGGADIECENFVQITDICPTIQDYLDLSILSPDGQSLAPVIEENETVNRESILVEEAHTQRRRAIRTSAEKLIYLVEGDTVCRYCGIEHAAETELFNLYSDSTESQNIANENPNRVESLEETAESIAEQFLNQAPESRGGEDIKYEDEEALKEHLEHLGYK